MTLTVIATVTVLQESIFTSPLYLLTLPVVVVGMMGPLPLLLSKKGIRAFIGIRLLPSDWSIARKSNFLKRWKYAISVSLGICPKVNPSVE